MSNIKIKYDDKGRKKYDFSGVSLIQNEEKTNEVEDEDKSEAKQKTYSCFYCHVCNIEMKDSYGYIEHIRGRVHNSKIGNSQLVSKVSLEKVRQKLLQLKRKSEIELVKERLNAYKNTII